MTGHVDWAGWQIIGDRLLADSSGSRRWVLQTPARRRWSASGALELCEAVDWAVEPIAGGSRLVVSASSEIDVVDLGRSAAQDFQQAHHPPLTVIGSFATLGPPEDLTQFLVGGAVLDTNEFLGRRCASEQTALSLYRIAHRRGGEFWKGVANHVAGVVAKRIEQATAGMPVHDIMGKGETHTRFLVDAILLLLAEAERRSEDRMATLANKALDALDTLAASWHDDTWYLHDTAERDAGVNQLVLNTHVHALIARLAADRPVGSGLRALDSSLSLPGERARGAVLAVALAASDRARASKIDTLATAGGRLHWMAEASAGRSRERTPHLRLPGGWMARDAGPKPNATYLIVNLHDLAVLHRNRPTPVVDKVLRAGLRYSRYSGFFDAQTAARDPAAVLIPSIFANTGDADGARRVAARLRRYGFDPTFGWPGFRDHLWSRLASGTP